MLTGDTIEHFAKFSQQLSRKETINLFLLSISTLKQFILLLWKQRDTKSLFVVSSCPLGKNYYALCLSQWNLLPDYCHQWTSRL